MTQIEYKVLERFGPERSRGSIPCSDTFHLKRAREEEILAQIKQDIIEGTNPLRYHVNCAQSSDIIFLVNALLNEREQLEGREIDVFATTLLDYSLDRISIDHADCYRRKQIEPIKRICLKVLQMDNENADHRWQFITRYPGKFTGSLCNIGGAILEPTQTADMLIQTTSDEGWIQTDSEWLLQKLSRRKRPNQRVYYSR